MPCKKCLTRRGPKSLQNQFSNPCWVPLVKLFPHRSGALPSSRLDNKNHKSDLKRGAVWKMFNERSSEYVHRLVPNIFITSTRKGWLRNFRFRTVRNFDANHDDECIYTSRKTLRAEPCVRISYRTKSKIPQPTLTRGRAKSVGNQCVNIFWAPLVKHFPHRAALQFWLVGFIIATDDEWGRRPKRGGGCLTTVG